MLTGHNKGWFKGIDFPFPTYHFKFDESKMNTDTFDSTSKMSCKVSSKIYFVPNPHISLVEWSL